MKQKLMATLGDIPILDAYLHDANFTPSDLNIDLRSGIFSLQLRRICYEDAKRGKFLFYIPFIQYSHVFSILKIIGVRDVRKKWKDIAFSGSEDTHTLLDIELKEDSYIEIKSEHLIVVVKVAENTTLVLEDICEPEAKKTVIDFSSMPMFQGSEEINMLRERVGSNVQQER